jgi:ribonuclease HII
MVDEERLPELTEMGVRDSKQLAPGVREELSMQLHDLGEVFLKVIQPHQIDAFNINRLEKMATRDIILKAKPGRVVIDAFEKNLVRKLALDTGHGLTCEIIAEHKADARYPIVGAASIVAKVLRDREIATIHETYGDFGSGYPGDPKTAAYVESLIKSHQRLPDFVRKSWGTVRRVSERESQFRLGDFLGE